MLLVIQSREWQYAWLSFTAMAWIRCRRF